MRIRAGAFSAVMWLYYIWLAIAFWIAHLLGIRKPWIWVYMIGHAAGLYVVGTWLEKKLVQARPNSSLIKVKLTAGRWAVIVAIAVTWVVGYIVLLNYFPRLLTGPASSPWILLCLPLLITVTVLEALWIRREP